MQKLFFYCCILHFQIEGEEVMAIKVLEQATAWKDDLTFPVLPPLKTATENDEDNRWPIKMLICLLPACSKVHI